MGNYQHTMDAKRRIPLPARLRDMLGKTVVIARGFESCLFVYPQNTWTELADKISKLPLTQASARSLARFIFSGAVEAELDQLGRVLVPEYLAAHAQLKKEVVVVGTGSRLEVWDKGRWETHHAREAEDISQTAEQLKEYGI
ncbi:MAG: Protein MraZ [Parcubacteria group bacterium GW2011_GWC2_45_7]|nr:MAG: Protein MraZ [Parcubacteria group bacterium GW2011_GWC2_45_7]KKU73168.1 MAG: Protein MraZ [Parcubacteria group bacterium GW2011_GWA2_47_26]